MTVPQFLIGYGFTTIGYPLGVTLIQTIFSKILGPRPQGVWMGLMTGAGCASRVLGPVFVGLIYTRYGTYQTFGLTGLMLIVAMIFIQILNKRLVPPEPSDNEVKDRAGDLDDKRDVKLPLVHRQINNAKKEDEAQAFNGTS